MTAKERADLVDAEFAKDAAELEFGKQVMIDMLERIRNEKASQLIAKGVIAMSRMTTGAALPDELKMALGDGDNVAIESGMKNE